MEADDERHVGTKGLCERYDVCPRTPDRWLNNPELGFPKPTMINGRRYWTLGQLRRWERERAARGAA
jgi:hypothetical protein